ncbi:MAG TPA: hypothetical protein VGP25_01175 [Gemmatimonadaceae bacterium]|nr:hypothetical protein [Gemmatimonadaceae bacterium]
MLSRAGTSLVELMVALALAALVLGAATSSLLHQQRGARWAGALGGAESQMRPLVQMLPSELAPLDAGVGDVVSGQASDSTLQLRAVVASSVTCDSASVALTLLPDATSGVAIGGVARAPVAGDSLWFYSSDSLGWQPRRVLAVAHPSTSCRMPASLAGGSYRLTLDAAAGVPGGTPVRVTRHERYAVYRASDGWWYLGVRAWSATTASFTAPQPIAGPFLRSLPGGAITGFRYFDSIGAVVAPNGTNEQSIARVRVSSIARVPSLAGSDTLRRDSADVALARRGAY